jgi:hypothetical protein
VYDFVEKELLDNLPSLAKTGPNDPITYGRVNYYTAYAALAQLYMNAQAYTGTPQWDKAIAACDEIINSAKFGLMPDYSDNFKRDNRGSTELIWVIPYDGIKATGFTMPLITLNPYSKAFIISVFSHGVVLLLCRNFTSRISIQHKTRDHRVP